MTAALLSLLLSAAPLQPVSMDVVVACRDTCTRYVPAKQASKICADCIRKGGGVAAWTDAYRGSTEIPESVVRAALQDSSWEVRWGVLRARARAQALDPSIELADYIRGQPEGPRRVEACVVAVGAGALSEGRVLEVAKRSCAPHRQQVREAISPHLYLPRASAQEDALRQLMLFLGEGAGRVVMTALRDRPEALDEVPAALLLRVATQEFSVGKILLRDADAGNAREMNRLLAIYSKQIDSLRPELQGRVVEDRREAVSALALYLPLSEPELERVVSADSDASVRLSAAHRLAEAADRTLAEEVRVRALRWAANQTPADKQVIWVELLRYGQRSGCGAVLAALADDPKLGPAVRGAAVGVMGACGEGKPMARVLRAAKDPEEAIRAGAMRALADLPTSKAAAELTSQALQDPSAQVVADALRTLSTQSRYAASLLAPDLVAHASPTVRLAAAQLLATDARPLHLTLLRDRVKVEPEAKVRVELTRALGAVGGSVATATLAELQANDPDEYVRKTAVESLRNLGFQR